MQLLEALDFARGSCDEKSTMRVLQFCRIKNGTLSATDFELTATVPVDADIEACPKLKTLYDAAKLCPDATLRLVEEGKRLRMTGKGFQCMIDCVPEDDYPSAPDEDHEDWKSIDGEGLVEAFEAVRPFAGTDDVRYWMNGVLVRPDGVTAANGHSICQVRFETGFERDMVVPAHMVDEVVRIGEAPVRGLAAEKHIALVYDTRASLSSTLIDVEWPDTERLMQPVDDLPAVPEGLFYAVKMLKPFAHKQAPSLHIAPWGVGTHSDPCEGTSMEVDGMAPDAGMLVAYDVLEKVGKVATRIDFGTPEAGKAVPFADDAGELRGVFMPMRG